jgi:cytochrome P450
MYMSPKVFGDPLAFVPERWTGDERFANDERSALQPFSVGPRDCLGKKYVSVCTTMCYYREALPTC